MTVTLPETLQYGKVVGRFVLAVADAPEDPDSLPNAVSAVGTINFTSMNPLTKETAATPPTTVVRSVISAAIDNNGYLYNPKDPTGPRGIWLVAGPYKVAYALNTGAIAGHDILVLPTHNDANPLDLISALPPGGPILTASQYAEVSARIDVLEVSGGGGGATDHGALTGLADDDHPQYLTQARGDARYYTETEIDSLLSGKAATTHTHDGAPPVVEVVAVTDTHTLALADNGKAVEVTSATPVDVTVPPNVSVAFPVGTVIEVYQLGAGQVSIVAGSGVTVESRGSLTDLSGQYAVASLRKRATDVWVLAGDLS